MTYVPGLIAFLYETAKDLEEQFLVDKIERNPEGKLTYVQYREPLSETAEPEHLQEIDAAIRRALKLGWDPNDEDDKVCQYSIFLWSSVEFSYLHRRADEILRKLLKETEHKGELP
ncbi:hypothetical protein F4Z99_04090 [Candidatus Poribacteria bacterium]|nr:hypothetical protein [Candidatus Poribacteria bacterium]